MKPRVLNIARLSFPLASALAALLTAQSAIAADGTWLGTSGDWNATGTWSGGTIADSADFTANFTGVDIAADQTITLTVPQTIGNITFTDATTSSNDLLITGANPLTLDVTAGAPVINVTQSGRALTINSVIAGADGLQKIGAGTLTLNGSAVNTFTGGLNVNGGTLTLDNTNLVTPTNLVDATNALQINNGALTITGQNLALATTVQTVASTSLGAGSNTVNIAKGGLATSATLNLGALTVNSGSATTFRPTTAWTTAASATERVFITAGGSVPALPGSGAAFINAGVFHRVAATTSAGGLRLAAVNSAGQLLLKANAGSLAAATGVDPTGTYQVGGNTAIALTNTGASVYSLLLNATTSGLNVTVANSGTLTLNSVIQIKASEVVNINAGTGTSNVVIGSEQNLMIAMDNTAGFAINAPIANNGSTGGTGGTASAVTILGTNPTGNPGTVTLGGANTYTGATTITRGTLNLTNTNPFGTTPGTNGTSGLTLGGASAATLSSTTTGITIATPITTANTGINSTIAFGRGTAAAGSLTLNGAIGGAGNVIFTTPNANSGGNLQTINLGATGTWSGSTTMNVGNINNTVTFKNTSAAANVLPITTVLTFGTGAGTGSSRNLTFDLNGQNQELAGLTNGGLVPNSRNHRVSSTAAATLTINNATDFTYGGVTVDGTTTTSAQISGAISLVKNGAGAFTLGGTLANGATAVGNSFTGSTRVLGGILVLGHSDSIKDSAFDTNASIAGDGFNGLRTTPSYLRIGGLTGGNDFSTRFTTTSGGYNTLTGLVLNPGTGATLTYSGDVGNGAGAMNLIKSGAGTQILAAAQSYTGTTTGTAGALIATIPAALPGYNIAGKVIFNGGTIGAQVGGAGWTTAEVDTLLTNATKTSGALGIDTTNGNLVQWTPFTTNFGALGLNKLGSGDLTLDQANTYTGATTVTAGTLTLTNANALQNSALVTTGAGTVILSGVTTLNLAGLNGTTGDLGTVISSGYSGVTALTLNTPAGALLNYGGNITDGASGMTVTKTGLGIQALSGTNSYTGATQINDGILVFRNKASKAAGTATAAAAGTIGLGVKAADALFYSEIEVGDLFNTTLSGFVLDSASGVAIDTTAASFDQTVALTAARSLTKLGANTLTLSQVNSYSGATNVITGTLSLTGSLTGGGAISTSGSSVLTQSAAGIISGASTITQGSTGTSSLAGANTYTGVTNVNLGQLTISNAAALGDVAGNTIVASGGRLAMATLNLSVAEPLNITGTGTTATNGALAFGGAQTGMALTGPITLGGAARIQADGSTGSTLSGGISLGANELTINTDGAATQTINTTAITGSGGSLVKSGGGTLVLGAANSYTGATTVNQGVLSITQNDALGTTAGDTTINGNDATTAASLSLTNATSDLLVAEPLNFNGNATGRAQLVNDSIQNHTLSGLINVSSDTNIPQFTSSGTGSITVSGDISGTFTNGANLFLRGTSTSATNQVTGSINLTGATLSKTDAGTWTVGAPGETYSWTNTSLFVGTLKMGAASVLPSATILTMGNTPGASTPTLDLNGFNQTIGGINYSGEGVATGTKTITSATAAVLTVNNATDFITTGTGADSVVLTGALALTKQGAGKLELNGVNTNSGDTTVSDGILSLTNADSALDANTANDASTVSIAAAAGAILDLAYTGTDEVDKLFIGGVQKAAGVWGSSTSGAPNVDAKFTGSGTLTVAVGPVSNNYASWAASQVPPVTEGVNGDDDKDGVKNLVEYALADGQERGTLTGNLLSFAKRGAPYGSDITYEIESSDNLGISDPWSTVTPDVNSASIISYTLPNPGDNFARLKVTQLP